MQVRKLTPVVIVDAIEPALPFWEGVGFTAVATVPHGDAIGFVILVREGAELMLQTRASLADDLGVDPPGVAMYAEVDTLDDPPGDLLIAGRTTFYGAQETWVRDPAGTLVGFALHAAPAGEEHDG